jgi:L-cysteine:1D-myo-inositol 2-amino-2-deoxy-alpha-D-glucopyranoside ligase
LSIYVCGVTPYDATHLGHVATFLTYDVLVRRLHDQGIETRVVRNITDLDDPILPRAQQLGVPYRDLVDAEVKQFHDDLRRLNFLKPDHEPLVSQMIEETIAFAEELAAKGVTYRVDDGTVFFDTSTSGTIGTLSRYPQELLIHYARERGGAPDDPRKRNPLDFVLWRPARPGEPIIPSSFGPGMPGWHIGCSAMARTLLGPTIDVHGGGVDLVHPHHECELAQSAALQQEPFVRTWIHCEFVKYQGEKMSKSKGNIVLARNLLARHDAPAIRLAILRQYRYRVGLEWRDTDIVRGERLLEVLRAAARTPAGPDARPWATRLRAALDDDLDFPTAVAELEELARAILAGGDDPTAPATLEELASLLGVDLTPA